jgi:ribonucleoside-diphosphate reductase beta chain
LIETLGLPETTYNQFLDYQEMKDKHDYVLDISSKNGDTASTATHIAVFSAFTEGMQLFSSFIMLLNFPRTGKMKGMGQIVTWSIVDETMHAESMIKLFRTYIEENKEIWNDELKGRIYSIAEKMVELEDKFIDLAFLWCTWTVFLVKMSRSIFVILLTGVLYLLVLKVFLK